MGVAKETRARAEERLAHDREAADRLPGLLAEVAAAEDALDTARDGGAPAEELHELGVALDTLLTEAMRAAYAHERVLVGPKGYMDRIQRRKRLAHPRVKHLDHALTYPDLDRR
ncbi:hypothetical protein ABZ631_26570, partial [Nocardiopsis alba]|uniref:hypothetical protein n=1 Tax=Nocardiopsis alba TaxID=53437 RepID=UPI0033F70BE8